MKLGLPDTFVLDVPHRSVWSVYYICLEVSRRIDWKSVKTWDYYRDIARKLKLLRTSKEWDPERGYSHFVKEICGSS